MLAGALFNRAADIFTKLVELEACGVDSAGKRPDARMRTVPSRSTEIRQAETRNGDEGIDELWGEPFKAFTMPGAGALRKPFVKIAMTMRNIDEVAEHMARCCATDQRFEGIPNGSSGMQQWPSANVSTLRTDKDIFSDVWSDFVVAGEAITNRPKLPA